MNSTLTSQFQTALSGAQNAPSGEKTLELILSKFSSEILTSNLNLGDAEIAVSKDRAHDLLSALKVDSELSFNMLVSLTAVDYMDQKSSRYEVVYHLLSLNHLHRLRVKISVSEQDCSCRSVVSIWKSANFMEREVYDMYGIIFTDHPDLRRILMYEEFEGHPLRKDYPVQGKQPRITMRSPEVRNTALDMIRPELSQSGASSNGELVSINKSK